MIIQELKDKNLIIFEGIVGSQAYGIATPTSDVDIKGVFILPLEDMLNFNYVEQVSDEKNDTTYYELRRFLQLVQTNNPNILELLNLPEDCILYKDPLFDMILDKKELFISKICKNSFGGYAVEQIKKARGLNKKIVKKFEKERLGILDFCYVPYNQGSISFKEFLKKEYPNATQNDVGLVAVPHMRYTYSVFLRTPAEIRQWGYFSGAVKDEAISNDVSLSSTEKQEMPKFIMQFNKDGYSVYCKEYKQYWEWVEKRNPHRFSDNMLHGKGYDGKNLAHCHRLLDMAIEIGEGKGINVRRTNREELLSIRRGEMEYDELLESADLKIKQMDEIFEKSSLPDIIDKEFVNNLLLDMRMQRYSLSPPKDK